MKRMLFLIFALLFFVLSFAACGKPPEVTHAGDVVPATPVPAPTAVPTPLPTREPDSMPTRIGILSPSTKTGWVAAAVYYAESRCAALSGTVEADSRKSGSADEMRAQLSALLEWGADVLLVYPQWEGLEGDLQLAVESGVVVILLDLPLRVDGAYRITGDNAEIGRMAADRIAELLGTEGTVSVFAPETVGDAASERTESFLEEMARFAPGIAVARESVVVDRETVKARYDVLQNGDEEPDAVFAPDDEIALGVLEAVRDGSTEAPAASGASESAEEASAGETETENKLWVLVGAGGEQAFLKEIAQSETPALVTAVYSPFLGGDAVDFALEILSGETVEPTRVVPPVLADRENAAEFIDEENRYY